MMNEQTLTKLHEMRLSGIAEAYKEQALNKEFPKISKVFSNFMFQFIFMGQLPDDPCP
ncbi:hypothetical protein [Siminovitchia sp. 179-K 8D1 HS]|uniref:hypothetical protein n=1 Tax=Siminovitchia sp. 179-K 8D1 HS TaxID=3142385 RepID=UPI0039A2B064